MYKALVKDAALYSISTVLARGFSLITVPIFTRILNPSDYGALDLLSYFAVLLPLLAGLALDQAIARYFPEASVDLEKKKMASTVIFYNVGALFVVSMTGIYYSGYIAGEWLENQVDWETVAMAFIYVWVNSLYFVANNQLKYMFLASKFAMCNIGNTVLSTALSVWFITSLDLGVFGIFLAQTIGQGCFAALSLYYGRESYAFVFDKSTLKTLVHYSIPLMPGTVAFMAMGYVDRYALNELESLKEVGIYGIGARLASLVNLFLVGFQGAWFPIIMKTYRTSDSRRRFSTVLGYFIFITSSAMLAISVFGQEILLLLTTSEFSRGYVVVPLLVGSAILSSVANYFSFGIEIEKKSSVRLFMNIIGLLLNIGLNVIFIRAYGLIGAALATFCSFALIAVIGMTVSQRLYPVPYRWSRLISAFTIAALISNLVVVFPIGVGIEVLAYKITLVLISVFIIAKLLSIASLREVYVVLRRDA